MENALLRFTSDFPKIFENYILPHIPSEAIVKTWNSNWLSFWQNQLNFAIWCATTGCGVILIITYKPVE